jgi:Tfp pilus assembly pilus retraction ATPase PilT
MEAVPSTLPQPEPSHGALLNYLLNPSPLGLAIAILLAISIPIFLHTVVFRASGLTTLPSILLTGPSGSGKTALVTLVCLISSHWYTSAKFSILV